ncbi:hypothetical protein SY83_22470 [Paenibacillus swuensis]|uniref:Uncharacterized protein n=1 Tax=Paenibacillus swuensis TaxID=1178515 RepID=A0A172TNN6_9BACL|nr:amylo-alpha-1,6-glucosidase [Paenibacillus swuensis]ANE48592.1 hypothetical protein SY83_22470 [Paenibacillus swuensis]
MGASMPGLITNNEEVNKAFRIALGDMTGNIVPYEEGLLEQAEMCLMAGLDYNTPWTRDTAINTWNGAGLLVPEVTKHTLLSLLERKEGGLLVIGGQYWDKISWVNGAWFQYLYTGDTAFLRIAYEASVNTIQQLEHEEFSENLGLFRGAACYGDGVAAYPDVYARTADGSSSILKWTEHNVEHAAVKGHGLPMHALSTNALYYKAYTILQQMERALEPGHEGMSWYIKADALKTAINQRFWNDVKGSYNYLVDPFGGSDAQEGMGIAFAVLFGIADESQIASLASSMYTAPAGLPCLWPNFERYESADGMSFGRHSGTVWPHIQAFWGEAMLRNGYREQFAHEFGRMTQYAVRDGHFAEIYHPINGSLYGGLQEEEESLYGMPYFTVSPDGMHIWKSCHRQTWCATGYIRMILQGMIGMEFRNDGIAFAPHLPANMNTLKLSNLAYRDALLHVNLQGEGRRIVSFKVNGEKREPFISAEHQGNITVEIILST